MLEPQVFADHQAMSRYVADWLIARLRQTPDALFCLAAGATPIMSYSFLVGHHSVEPRLFDRMRVLKLDEWGGLAMDDPASCEQHLRNSVVNPLGLEDRYIAFDSRPADPEMECARIARWLADNGPIDTCVLGLGINGHLGFNEPAAYLHSHAHVARLSEDSLRHAMLRDASGLPTYGLTLGMADLLQARHVLLLVSGAAKSAPLHRLLNGPISTDFPASFLVLHQDVEVICDTAAFTTPV